MNSIFMYLLIASATIASPGPGVVLSITNALTHNKKNTLCGILGLSLGMLAIAIVSATSVGVLIATSPSAFLTLQIVGAFYIFYMGSKMWLKKSPSVSISATNQEPNAAMYQGWGLFKQGLLTSSSNPKPILFFMAVLPQFIRAEQAYVPQFLWLSLIFCALVVVIHCCYAGVFSLANKYLWQAKDNLHFMTKIGGAVLIALSVVLLVSAGNTMINT